MVGEVSVTACLAGMDVMGGMEYKECMEGPSGAPGPMGPPGPSGKDGGGLTYIRWGNKSCMSQH